MDNEKITKVLRKLQAYKTNPELVREPTIDEMASLVILVLDQVKVIENAIKEGRLDGKTPEADKDYLSHDSATRMLTEAVNKAISEMDTKLTEKTSVSEKQVAKALKTLKDGKNGIITEEEIQRAAELAFEMIDLPDVDSKVEERITATPEAVRDALELLPEGERLAMGAVDKLSETIEELRSETKKQKGGGGLSTTRVLQLIATQTLGGLSDVTVSTTEPSSPSTGDFWVDIS